MLCFFQQERSEEDSINFIIVLEYNSNTMKKNHSYSLQRIHPNHNRGASRVLGAKQRLIFPHEKDSDLYGGVGRKHYEKPTHYIHKLIFNPETGAGNPFDNQILGRYNSEGHLKPLENKIAGEAQKPNSLSKQPKEQIDSLTALERQFDRKVGNQSPIPHREISSEPIKHKNNLPPLPKQHSTKDVNSHFRLFGSVDNIYDYVSKQSKQWEGSTRRFNPTYLSSDLGFP